MSPTSDTLSSCVERGARRFVRAGLWFGHGTDNARDESFHLACHALGWTPRQAVLRAARRLSPAQRQRVERLHAERIRTRKPAAYLSGEAWFCGLAFTVDERVLIPRSPMAELVESRFRPWLARAPRRVLDLCAGSGCIGIAAALYVRAARVDLAELDPAALEVARINVRRHRVGRRVRAIRSDLFDALAGETYDLILTNPPYVPTQEWRGLPAEYRHEPRRALESGRDGMDCMARILDEAAAFLSPEGTLIGEIGGSQREFARRFPSFPAVWPEFERGGDGVFIISREELIRWKANVR